VFYSKVFKFNDTTICSFYYLLFSLSVSEYKLTTENAIQYDQITQEIIITNEEKIGEINLYDSQGKTMMSTKPVTNKICIENLPSGLYIVELITKDSKVIRQKIIK
jgi:hypothetical protein